MLRRNLTKIELKLEDLQELENNSDKQNRTSESNTSNVEKSNVPEPLDLAKTRIMVESRIGYNPRPRRNN